MNESRRTDLATTLIAGAMALLTPVPGAAGGGEYLGLISGTGTYPSLVTDEWRWALGDHARLRTLGPDRLDEIAGMAAGEPEFSLLVVDNVALPEASSRQLAHWVRSGGTLLLAGPRVLKLPVTGDGEIGPNRVLLKLAGLKAGIPDPGQAGAYPRLVSDDPALSPFTAGDGIRLGPAGLGHSTRPGIGDARVLARSFHLRPGPGAMILESRTPTITTHNAGNGRVLYLAFSPGEVAACYPNDGGDDAGAATDCAAAGTAHTLMRHLAANLLWEDHGIQWPLPWENPGPTPLAVVITGDVHMETADYQVQSAVQVAERLANADIPVTWFTVGEVARQAADHFRKVAALENVEIATHSARGDQYRPNRLEGVAAVRDDIRTSEEMLGLPHWPGQRNWRSAIRTEAWASDQSRARAWEGMASAGIGLVFDHNADALLPRPQWTAPQAWFKTPARKRLFLPMFERNVATAVDDFRMPPELARQIASLGSPEPDPCCNHAVRFETYLEYVRDWHAQFRRMGVMGGLTSVWLWHPSTPGWKGGLEELVQMLREWRRDPRVRFFHASEVATWQYNRRQVRAIPRFGDTGRLIALDVELPGPGDLLPLPPGASAESAAIGFWVLGNAAPPGWDTRHFEDDYGRTITLMRRELPLPEQRQ